MHAQSCPTLCNRMDCSLPGSSVHGDSPGKQNGAGCRALLPGDLPNPLIELRSPVLQTDSLLSEPPRTPYICSYYHFLNCFGSVFVGLFLLLCFPPREVPSIFVVRLFWWYCILLSSCFSLKLLISPSNLNEILAGQSNLGCRFFPFIFFKYILPLPKACRVSAEKSVNNLMGVRLYVIFCF